MKKIIKLFFAFVVSLIVFTSCSEKTPTQPVFDCNNDVHDASTEWSKDKTKHWHACSLCESLVDKAAHKWTDWTVTKEATATEKGSKWRECTVCAYKAEEEIPMLAPEAIKTDKPMSIYVIAPSDWTVVNCYYWQSDEQGEPGNGGTIASVETTTWPGIEMTLVDQTQNLWGFIIPANTNMIIFNNGNGVQTIDIQLKPTNLYKLTTEAITDGKFDVDEYTKYEDNSGLTLNQYPTTEVTYEYMTIYAQLPETWTGHKIYFWETKEAPSAWPGADMELVDADLNLYKFKLPTLVTTVIFCEGDQLAQTENVTLVKNANTYVIVPVEDANATVTYANYDDTTKTLTPVTVE